MSEWKPIETIPEEGFFLVFMPEAREGSRIQAAKWRKGIKTIGNVFDFDCNPATHWMEQPSEPSNTNKG